MRPYPQRQERIFTSLDGFEAGALPKAVRRRRKTVCAGQRYPFKWLRINPCIQKPEYNPDDIPVISNSATASELFHSSVDFSGRGVEYGMVMCTDIKNRPTAVAVVAQGGRASTQIEPSIVFQAVVLSNSSGFIFAHNHPSQVTVPSDEDIVFSERLYRGAKLVGVTMLDSLILTDSPREYRSLLDAGLLGTGEHG